MSSSKHPFARGRRPVADAAFDVSTRLTERDRDLVRTVGRHRVLTTGQLCDLAFDSLTRARHRLAELERLGPLRRFRPHRDTGSAPWHYVLRPLGAELLTAEDGGDTGNRWRDKTRVDRQLALERSQRLAHLLGVNGFFVALAHAERHGHGQLRAWLSEAEARFHYYRASDLVRPDGLGVWAEAGHEVTFMVEYDNGTENMTRLAGKISDYAAFADHVHTALPLMLFSFTSTTRETNARRAFTRHRDAGGLPLVTATWTGDGSPAGSIWQPLGRAGRCLRLVDLPAHISAGLPPALD